MRSIEVQRYENPEHTLAEVLLTARVTDDGELLAHGEARFTRGRWQLVTIGDPSPDALEAALRRLIEEAREEHATRVDWWVDPADDTTDAIAEALGLARDRALLQLRRPLPIEGLTSTLETRAFRIGEDEDAWLEVNNAAFAWHEDQSDWTIDDLRQRMGEDWFDPEGFRIHERSGRIAGFCWTKVHAEHDPPLGEIFVIGAHPDFQGQGLGVGLTLAGLDHLTRAGIRVVMLYVETDNVAGLKLYDKLGFEVHQRNQRYSLL